MFTERKTQTFKFPNDRLFLTFRVLAFQGFFVRGKRKSGNDQHSSEWKAHFNSFARQRNFQLAFGDW